MTAVAGDLAQLQYVNVASIAAGKNDRTAFDPTELASLARSIERDGLAQPPTLRPLADGTLEIVAGERRIRAMRDVLGWSEIPAFVRPMDDAAARDVMLVENMVRVDLDPVEEAKAYSGRLNTGSTVEELASLVGVSQRTIRARVELLRLGPDALALISAGQLALAHAAQMVGLDADRQSLALRALSAGDLSLAAFTGVCDRLRREQETEPMFSADLFWSVEEYVASGQDAANRAETVEHESTRRDVDRSPSRTLGGHHDRVTAHAGIPWDVS